MEKIGVDGFQGVVVIGISKLSRQRNAFQANTEPQGCQMAYFRTKNSNLGKFWRVLEWKMLVGILYGHLEDFTAI
jgi:hypothetical protein